MKTKVVYIVALLVLSGLVLKGQKPAFDLLPAGKHQNIPKALVDTKYYNDTTQGSHASLISDEDSIPRVETGTQNDSPKVLKKGRQEDIKAKDTVARRLVQLIYPPRIRLGVTRLFFRVHY